MLSQLLDQPKTGLSLLLLVVGTLVAAWAVRHPRWDVTGAALAVSGAGAWILTNGPVEGKVLASPLPNNGLTQGDLLVLPALLLALGLAVRGLRR